MGGACCGNKEKNLNEKDQDLSRKDKKKKTTKANSKNDDDVFKDLDVFKLIKF